MRANPTNIHEFEDDVRAAMAVQDGDMEFLNNLRLQVIDRSLRQDTGRLRRIFRPILAGALILILILTISIVVNPQKVSAAIQALLGYVPGVGFVSTENAMVLQEPVERNQNGQTFEVNQLVLSGKETVLVIHLTNFPPYQDVGLNQGVKLELEDGNAFFPHSYGVEITPTPGEYYGVFKFNCLPVGTRQITVTWKQAIDRKSSESIIWQIPVTLSPVSASEFAKIIPTSYEPGNAFSTWMGITLKVDHVSNSKTDTAIRLQMIFPEVFNFIGLNINTLELMDDRGQTYPRKNYPIHFEDNGQAFRVLVTPGSTPRVFNNLHETVVFSPIDSTVNQLTLRVGQLDFRASPRIKIPVDLGDQQPSAGDAWPVNQIISVGDFSFQVKRARMITLRKDAPGSNGQSMVGLVLDLEPVDSSRVLVKQIWLSGAGAQEVYDKDTMTWALAWLPGHLPAGPIEIHLDSLQGVINGSWQIHWNPEKP